MPKDVIIAGYQGPRSILTRGLTAFAEASLPSATLVPDVTADGVPAQTLFEGVERGDYAVAYLASGYLTSRVPELGVLDIPFSVSDRKSAHSRLDGSAGRQLTEAVASTTGIEVLAFWDNGFRHLTNRVRPIASPADCRGLKVRTLNNQLYKDTLAGIGFEPVVTDVKDLVDACESGLVQAQENPLTNVLTFGLDRWHKHLSLTGHIYGVVLLVANKRWFRSIPSAQQAQIMVGAQRATLLQRKLAEREDTLGLEALVARGAKVLRPDALDLPAFRRAVAEPSQRALSALPAELVAAYLD